MSLKVYYGEQEIQQYDVLTTELSTGKTDTKTYTIHNDSRKEYITDITFKAEYPHKYTISKTTLRPGEKGIIRLHLSGTELYDSYDTLPEQLLDEIIYRPVRFIGMTKQQIKDYWDMREAKTVRL